MKLKFYFVILVLATVMDTYAQQTKPVVRTTVLPRPKLVIGLMVDQMRWDFLYRYYERYGIGGFKRMLNEGFSCENTYINYIPTITAPGHSSAYTGSVPAIHGLTGNDFIIQATGKLMYCTADSLAQTVGSNSVAGRMSPKNLLASTITDELKLATNFRSKVIGIALKDRGSILAAGHLANAAYWYDDLTGNWITSTYYMKELPYWAKSFNEQKLVAKYMSQDWNTLYPLDSYKQSTADDNAYEGKLEGALTPTFPVKTSLSKGFGGINYTPYGNSLTLDMAKAAIQNENLGKSSETDFLALSLSSTDYIGHRYGPNSVEMEDAYLRLDRDLSAFFSYLDKNIGKGNYTIFLSADHGAAHNPTFLADNNMPAGLWPSGQIMAELNTALEAKYSLKNLVLSFTNYQVSLNNKLIETAKLDEAALRKYCIEFLQKKAGIAYVVDMRDLKTANIPSEISNRILNSYNAERSGAIQIVLKPGWFSGTSKTGTSHGTWNAYDSHIPLLWMGWGVNHGITNAPVYISDIASTIGAILHIQAPSGNIGKPIIPVIK